VPRPQSRDIVRVGLQAGRHFGIRMFCISAVEIRTCCSGTLETNSGRRKLELLIDNDGLACLHSCTYSDRKETAERAAPDSEDWVIINGN
jgi:hypothetical protein